MPPELIGPMIRYLSTTAPTLGSEMVTSLEPSWGQVAWDESKALWHVGQISTRYLLIGNVAKDTLPSLLYDSALDFSYNQKLLHSFHICGTNRF